MFLFVAENYVGDNINNFFRSTFTMETIEFFSKNISQYLINAFFTIPWFLCLGMSSLSFKPILDLIIFPEKELLSVTLGIDSNSFAYNVQMFFLYDHFEIGH